MRDRAGWILLVVGFLIVAPVLGSPQSSVGAGREGPQIRLDVSKAAPREVEDQTGESVARDYGKAWQSLEQALEQNRADLLNGTFVGYALDRWLQTVKAQEASGLSRRIADHGHRVEVVFYSAEGSAMQLRDTVQLEIQYLDGETVIHKEGVTAHYLVLMTPAENSWKVRILQEIAPESAQPSAAAGVHKQGSGSK
jgi:hypothetical protein